MRTGAIRLQPRSSPRPAADRLRPVVHDGGLPGRRRGLRRQSRRSEHARQLAIADTSFAWSRKAAAIAAEAALDGVYVIRSNLPEDGFPAAAIVLAYKGLSHAERGFRDLKSGDLDVRPIHHRRAHRVRAHVFLCMLAYYVIWHMKRDLAPMLFKDDNPAAAAAQRSSPVAKAKVSPAARRKAARKRTEDGQPVHSFRPSCWTSPT